MSGGWYIMRRRWMDSADFKPGPFCEAMAFQWTIDRAAWEPHLQWFNGVQYPVARGEFVTSYRKLADAFGWSLNRLRGFAERMERCGKWELKPAQEGIHPPTLLRLCNYERYQALPRRDGTGAATPADTPSDTPPDTGPDTQHNLNPTAWNEEEPSPSGKEVVQAAIGAWNGAAVRQGWPEVRGSKGSLPGNIILSPHLQRNLNARLREEGLDGMLAAIARAERALMISGPAPPSWWTFSAFVSASKFESLKEGKYDQPLNDARQQSGGWGDASRYIDQHL
jgi:hypothetical protein